MKVTYVVQERKRGAARWKDSVEYDTEFDATDYRDDVAADGEPIDYQVVKRTWTKTDTVL